MIGFEIVERRPTPREYNRLLAAVNWPRKEASVCERAMANTVYCVCGVVNDQVVGMGRIVGDGATWNYIQDVIVLPEHHGHGIGGAIMEAIMTYLRRSVPRGSDVALIAAPEAFSFYERWGFSVCPPDRPAMRRKL
jgi:GNAT superfamily N-acetyltransferase